MMMEKSKKLGNERKWSWGTLRVEELEKVGGDFGVSSSGSDSIIGVEVDSLVSAIED